MNTPPSNLRLFPETVWLVWLGRRLNMCPQTNYEGIDAWLVFGTYDDAFFWGENICPFGAYEIEECPTDELDEVFGRPTWLIVWDRLYIPGRSLPDTRPMLEIPFRPAGHSRSG